LAFSISTEPLLLFGDSFNDPSREAAKEK